MDVDTIENFEMYGKISHIDASDGVVVVTLEDADGEIFEHYFPGRQIEADLDFKFLTGAEVMFDYFEEDDVKMFIFDGETNILQLLINDEGSIVYHELHDKDDEGNIIEPPKEAINDNQKIKLVE